MFFLFGTFFKGKGSFSEKKMGCFPGHYNGGQLPDLADLAVPGPASSSHRRGRCYFQTGAESTLCPFFLPIVSGRLPALGGLGRTGRLQLVQPFFILLRQPHPPFPSFSVNMTRKIMEGGGALPKVAET